MTKIIQDVRQGKNIESYTIIVLALIIVVLDVFDVADPSWVSGVILASLAFLVYSRIQDRHQLEAIFEEITLTTEGVFLESFPDDMSIEINKSKELWLMGVSLNPIIGANYARFERKLKSGHSIRVLLVNPDGVACEMSSMRMPVPSSRHQSERIRGTLNYLSQLKKSHQNRTS